MIDAVFTVAVFARWVCALSGSVHGRTGEFREAHSIAATPACEARSEYTPSLCSSPRMDACQLPPARLR